MYVVKKIYVNGNMTDDNKNYFPATALLNNKMKSRVAGLRFGSTRLPLLFAVQTTFAVEARRRLKLWRKRVRRNKS